MNRETRTEILRHLYHRDPLNPRQDRYLYLRFRTGTQSQILDWLEESPGDPYEGNSRFIRCTNLLVDLQWVTYCINSESVVVRTESRVLRRDVIRYRGFMSSGSVASLVPLLIECVRVGTVSVSTVL